ncbi:vWA domain-containing protein [Avibacterium avium]|uniref:vWA domain-containing protein n=1 Tax=Avibacterium avium TaxID=751 RepID=UPI003BF7D826
MEVTYPGEDGEDHTVTVEKGEYGTWKITNPDENPGVTVTKVTVNGVDTTVPANGQKVTVSLTDGGKQVGTLEIQSDGTYKVTPVDGYTGALPVINYTITDGKADAQSTLTVTNENVEKDGHFILGRDGGDTIRVNPSAIDGPSEEKPASLAIEGETTNQADVVIGDQGGTNSIVKPGGDYNAVVLLDVTRSMGNPDPIWRTVKAAVKELITKLGDHDGTVNFELVTFAQDAEVVRKYSDFTAAMSNSTTQNYENVTYFISDGSPSWDTPATAFAAYDPVAAVSKVHSIGITGVTNSPFNDPNKLHIMDYFDNTPADGGEATVPERSLVDFPNWRPATMEGHAAGDATLIDGSNLSGLNTALETGDR